jgi:hypothetical protein
MGVLGHSTVKLTLTTYSPVALIVACEAATALSRALWRRA